MKTPEIPTKKIATPSQKSSLASQQSKVQKKAVWKIDISTKTIVRFWLLGGLFTFLGYLFVQSLDMIYLIFTALIISVAMEGIIYSFEKRLKTRGIAIALAYLILMLFLFSGIIFVIPFLVSQISMLISRISSTVIQLKNFIITNQWPDAIAQITRLPEVFQNYLLEHWETFSWSQLDVQSALLSSLNTLLDTSASSLKQLSSGLFSAIGGFFGVLANLTIVFTLAVFFSIEKAYLISLFVRGSNEEKKEKIRKNIDNIYEKLSLWLKARVLLSLFVAVAMYLAFWILKLFGIALPSMFSLALMTGLLDIIPYLGPIFAFIPIIVLALIYNGFWGMLTVGLVFVIVQWVQNNVITPLLMEKQLGVNSVLILVSALIGAVVMGFWGIILSVPLAVIIGLFIDEK